MTDVEGAAVRSGGVSLHVARFGEGRRTLVLHGGPGLDHRTVVPLAATMAAAVEVWLPDLPGHGASRRSGEPPPALDTLLAALGRWLDGFDRPWDAVVGHSLGAWIAAELMRCGRLRPAAAVLISPPATGPNAGSPVRRGVRMAGRRRRRADSAGGNLVREEIVQLVADETGRPPPPAFVEEIRRARLLPPRRFDLLLRQLHRRLLEPTPRWRPPAQVLVLCGERDGITPPDQARLVAETIEGADLRVIPGVGHFPFAGDDGATGRETLAFLRRAWDDGGQSGRRSSTQ